MSNKIIRTTHEKLSPVFAQWLEDEDSAPRERWLVVTQDSCTTLAVDNRNGDWDQAGFEDEYSAMMWLLGLPLDSEYFDYSDLIEEATP